MARPKKDPNERVHITPAGLEELCKEIWGDEWRGKFSEATGISYSQLHRYMTVYNGQRIPQVVVVALEGIRLLGKTAGLFPTISHYSRAASEATPVKFVAVKKERPERAVNDAPLADFFNDPPPKAPEPTETPPEPPAAEPEAPKEEPKPAKARTIRRDLKAGPGPDQTGPEKGRAGEKKGRAGSTKQKAKTPAKAKPAATKPKTPAKAKATK